MLLPRHLVPHQVKGLEARGELTAGVIHTTFAAATLDPAYSAVGTSTVVVVAAAITMLAVVTQAMSPEVGCCFVETTAVTFVVAAVSTFDADSAAAVKVGSVLTTAAAAEGACVGETLVVVPMVAACSTDTMNQ